MSHRKAAEAPKSVARSAFYCSPAMIAGSVILFRKLKGGVNSVRSKIRIERHINDFKMKISDNNIRRFVDSMSSLFKDWMREVKAAIKVFSSMVCTPYGTPLDLKYMTKIEIKLTLLTLQKSNLYLQQEKKIIKSEERRADNQNSDAISTDSAHHKLTSNLVSTRIIYFWAGLLAYALNREQRTLKAMTQIKILILLNYNL